MKYDKKHGEYRYTLKDRRNRETVKHKNVRERDLEEKDSDSEPDEDADEEFETADETVGESGCGSKSSDKKSS